MYGRMDGWVDGYNMLRQHYLNKVRRLLYLDPVHNIPVRNDTVTKSLRLGLAFTRYRYEKAWNRNANRNDLKL